MSLTSLDTEIAPRWRGLTRAIWVAITGTTIVLFVMALPLFYANIQIVCNTASCSDQNLNPAQAVAWSNLGRTMSDYAILMTGVYVVFGAFFLAIGALIFLRKSDDWLAVFVSITLITFGLLTIQSDSKLLPPDSLIRWLMQLLAFVGNVSIFAFFAIFPSGRPVPRWVIVFPIVWAIYEFFEQIAPGVFGRPSLLLPELNAGLFLLMLAVGIFALVYRYRFVSTPREKQQTKWVVYGTSLGVGTFFVLITLFGFVPQIQAEVVLFVIGNVLLRFALLIIPLSIAVAILRSHLWDIDFLIRRTVTYSIITAMLLMLYFASVVLIQQIFRNLTGQASDLAIIVSTLAIAALFNPLRRRVQNIIDQRFYRHKYDAQQVLAQFSATVRDEVEIEKLTTELLRVVNETMQPTHVSLWLRATPKHGDRLK